MLNAEFYDLTQSVAGAFFRAMAAVHARSGKETEWPPVLQLRAGLAESPGWFMVQAVEFDPEPLTVANLRVRDVYASPRLVAALLELMASEKWFDRRGEGEYYLTQAGRDVIKALRRRRHQPLATLKPIPMDDIERLESLLSRVIAASLNSPDPPGTWCLAHSLHRAPGERALPLVKVFHYLADFNAFRDDAHMAAWQAHDVSGHTWEAFDLVCSEEADSADSVFDQLAYRGYSRSEYGAALEELAHRDWLTSAGQDTYRVTETGWTVRQEVECLTDDYFYAPWTTTLNEGEIAEVRALLIELRDGLQASSTQ